MKTQFGESLAVNHLLNFYLAAVGMAGLSVLSYPHVGAVCIGFEVYKEFEGWCLFLPFPKQKTQCVSVRNGLHIEFACFNVSYKHWHAQLISWLHTLT